MDVIADPARSPELHAHWPARLDVQLCHSQGRTKLGHLAHFGPLRIQRPFYPESDGTAHLYILHPPGGIAGGDSLSTTVEAGKDTRSLFTTPAATKFYRSLGPRAQAEQHLCVRAGAMLEWLPQEAIAFSGSQASLKTVVHLEEGAQFLGWEILCLGRPAAGDDFERGRVSTRFEVHRGRRPLFVDHLVVGEESHTRGAVWGLRGHSVTATMLLTTVDDSLVSLVRHSLEMSEHPSGAVGCTALSGLTVIRYVGSSVPQCWMLFGRIWEAVRPVLTGRPAIMPRIWSC